MRSRLQHVSDSLGWALLAAGTALAAAWVGQGFWALAVPAGTWRGVATVWFAAFVLAAEFERLWIRGRRSGELGATAAAHAAACVVLAWWLHRRGIRLGELPALRLAVGLGLALLALRLAVRRAAAHGARPGGESLRLLGLLGVAALAAWPFVTADYAGGLDARWYAYMLQDYLQQLRTGVFPVLVGQGPFAFNGAVHPFRFAPYYQNLAGLFDWMTARTLGVFALQHAPVVASAAAAAIGAYACLAALAPARRWAAALVAAAYVLTPAFWGLISMADAYMSFLALPWLPLLLYGVLRVVERHGARDYVLVAVVLSVLWTCHPPVALWATGTALAVLGLAWLASGCRWREALALAGCLALCGGLSAGYLEGVLELLPHGSEPPPSPGYLYWLAGWGALWIAGVFLGRRVAKTSGPDAAADTARWLVAAGVASLAVLAVGRQAAPFAPHQAILDTLTYLRKLWPGLVLPVSLRVEQVSDIQPGYTLLLLGALALAVAWPARRLPLMLLAAAALAFALLLFPVPAVTAFLWGHMPMKVITTTSGAVSLRLAPVWSAALAYAGFLALAWLADRHRTTYRCALGVLAGAVIWSGVEVQKPAQLTHRLTHSAAESADTLRPENAQLFIYSYNFIGMPPEFSFGVVDYHLASRLYNVQTGLVDPDLAEHAPVPPAANLNLTWTYDPRQPSYLALSPPLEVPSGQRMLARFDFTPPEPRGTLVLSGPHLYREYLLPSSGGDKSFGAGPVNSRDLVLWNSGPRAERVALGYLPAAAPAPTSGPQVFARVAWGPLPDDALPVRTEALVPDYRARVDAKTAALLESPRIYIPGYMAWRNGRPAEVLHSPENRVAVMLAPGPNEVVIRFVGSAGLHRALWLSVGCWLGVLFFAGAQIMRTRRA